MLKSAKYDKSKSELTLVMEMRKEAKASASGKTNVWATTGGNVVAEGVTVDGKPLVVGVNAYTRVKD